MDSIGTPIFTGTKPYQGSNEGIDMAAKSKPIEELDGFYSGNKTEIIEMKLPPAKSGGKIFTNGKDDVSELVKLLREEAKVI